MRPVLKDCFWEGYGNNIGRDSAVAAADLELLAASIDVPWSSSDNMFAEAREASSS